MFTNNYILFQKTRFSSRHYADTVTGVKNAVGTTCEIGLSSAYSCDIGGWLNRGRCAAIVGKYTGYIQNADHGGVYFGAGSTPATKEDYCLEAPITSGLTITNPSALTWENGGNGKYTVAADYLVRNTTESDINIGEIGVFVSAHYNSYTNLGNSTENNVLLMERTVLETPVTIPAGEARLIEYKITFNQS